MLSTILFLSREGVRNALLRAKTRTTAVVNVAVLPILVGLPLALGTSYLYARSAGEEARVQPSFGAAVGLYAFAAFLELLSEPMHNK